MSLKNLHSQVKVSSTMYSHCIRNRHSPSITKKNPKITTDKETLYASVIDLKKSVNKLKRSNKQLKVKLQSTESECSKKSKFMQELATKLKDNLPQTHKETLLNSPQIKLRQRIQELERENAKLKRIDMVKQKNAEYMKYRELRESSKAYKKECKRLRGMLEELLVSKHEGSGSAEIETRVLELKATVKELRRKNEKLKMRLNKLNEIENETKKMIKKLEQKEIKIKELIDNVIQQKATIQKLKQALVQEKNLDDLNPLADTKYLKEIEDLKINNVNLKKENEQLKKVRIKVEGKLLEVQAELTELKLKSNEEDKHIEGVKGYHTEPTIKDITLLKPDSITKPLIRDSDLVYTKMLFRVILIKCKKNLDELEDEIFNEYKYDEFISIKELIKVFQRQPLSLDGKSAEELARYLIEAESKQPIVYDKFREQQIYIIKSRLNTLLKIDYPHDFYFDENDITQSALSKIKEKIGELKVAMNDVLLWSNKFDYKKWRDSASKICSNLTPIENDYLVSIMTEQNDLQQLNFSVSIGMKYRI